MAHYSYFTFKLPNCPKISLTTRYGVLMATDWGSRYDVRRRIRQGFYGTPVTKLSKKQRSQIQSFINVIRKYGNDKERVPRRWRKYILCDGTDY